MSNPDEQWFYDPATGEVSQGKKSGWQNRMGPYASREEAAHAIEIAQQRNAAADAEEAAEDEY
ncbi:hypothetical protein [Corynebacterium sp.]|uniref:hypothetical protein n=1 Tax=Corynebacterium sp. TaxID=1720 RepID=UPI0026DDC96F|nr:hypothetical protein [Corynebacterium sp.]MDO5031321.1 hypothetical protein [Corynebacterium sp.]